MRKITVAKTAGFCFGVERAVETVYEQVRAGKKPVYTYGPIIHNEQVVSDLEKKGVRVLNEEEIIPAGASPNPGTVVIRSHGVSREVYERLENSGFCCVDATCPFVKKIHRIVERESRNGSFIVIIGNAGHPEVQGIKGWVEADCAVIETEEEARAFHIEKTRKICVVSQTTFNNNKFKDLVEILEKKGYNINCVKTICNATEERQREAQLIAETTEAMVVIGGRHSSNTQKLYEICKKECKNTYYIQTLSDLDMKVMRNHYSIGITAGASTPKKIIEEVQKSMSEFNFDEALDKSLKTIHNGEIVEGTVIDVKEDEIILNIGYKADGIITRSEYTNVPDADLRELVKAGDTMEAKVLKVNDGDGQVALSYKAIAAERGNAKLEAAFNDGTVIKAPVVQVLNGGLSAVFEESRIFIPASLVSDVYEKDLSKYAGQEIEFKIIEFNPKRRRVIGDRKQLLIARKEQMAQELLERIAVGDVVEGIVKNVTDFGAFVDLGGLDGLLHISEMSWGRVDNPKKLFRSGDTLRVFIKDIKERRIALSLKFDETNPWTNAEEKYAVGNIVKGKVARMTDFGAFVELEPGVDALLHVSQISRAHVEKPSDVLKTGQEVEVKIIAFNPESKKISLSMKALETPAAAEKEASEDAPVEQAAEDATLVYSDATQEEAAEEAPVEETTAEETSAETTE